MDSRSYRLYSRTLNWTLAVLATTYVAFAAVLDVSALAWTFPILLFLIGPATFAAHLATTDEATPSARLAMTFVLAGLVLLPGAGCLVLALAAALAGRGGGVGGSQRRGLAHFTSIVVGVATAEFFASLLGWPANLGSLATLGRLTLFYLVIQGFALALGLALDADARDGIAGRAGPTWRNTLFDMASVPLAWILVDLLAEDALAPAVVLSLLVLVLLQASLWLERTLARLGTANDALAARVTELATLNGVGRAILSSMEPVRIFALLDRECRKIFAADWFYIALVEPGTSKLHVVHQRRRGARATSRREPLQTGPALRSATTMQALRIDDLRTQGEHAPRREDRFDPRNRSALAAPLVVGDHVIGVIGLENRTAGAYGDSEIALLATVAQQAAVAIESARHYQMATVDSLTGFFLRDYFFRRLEEECKRVHRYGGHFALLMVDLDEFKQINDRNGHLAGDHYLRMISDTIRSQLREADLACRYGGDEFCLLLPETDRAGAQIIAERVREAVARKTVGLDDAALQTTASIGIAAVPEHDSGELQALMRKADEALYKAKRSGRDCVVPFAA